MIRLIIGVLALVGCVEHGKGTTVREAVEAFAPAVCERMQRCQAEFPFESVEMCADELVDARCGADECDAPFAGTEEDLAACIEAFEQFPCIATIPPPSCLEVDR